MANYFRKLEPLKAKCALAVYEGAYAYGAYKGNFGQCNSYECTYFRAHLLQRESEWFSSPPPPSPQQKV
jgi:hypothetical protein